MIKMIFTKHARWYCGVATALGVDERLRAAVFILTPRERRFIEFREYRRPEERRRACVRTVLHLYREEKWYRRPRTIFCRHREVAAQLRDRVGDEVKVRTNRNARKFDTAARIFKEHAESTSRRSRWSRSGRVKLRK